MSWIDGMKERLKAIVRRGSLERQLESEIRFHLEMETEKNIQAGMSTEEARRRAERSFGRLDDTKESVRDERGVALVEDTARDVRFGLRRLRKRPGFTAVMVLTLALGIGASTAIFSVVHGVLLKPLPYPASERLVYVYHDWRPGGEDRSLGLTDGSYFIYREENRSFEEMGGLAGGSMTLTGGDRPERVIGGYLTSSLFATLRVAPVLGRVFNAEDDSPEAEPVVVISHGFWRRRFGGSPDALGETLRIDNVDHLVIGVMPADFRFPNERTELWKPLQLDRAAARSINYWMPAIARLKEGVTPERAAAELDALFSRQFELFPNDFTTEEEARADGIRAAVIPLKEATVGDVANVLWVILAAVGIILLIACANVANLFLVQAEEQDRELAMRRAIGASGAQLARYFIVQSLLLALAGGGLGVAFAYAGLQSLAALGPELPRLGEIGIDTTVLAVAAILSIGAAMFFGAFPLFRIRGISNASLAESGRRFTSGVMRHRARNSLAVLQLAMALVLLAGSGLMLRTFLNLHRVDSGLNAENLLTFRVSLPRADYPGPDEMGSFHMEVVDRLRALPGVSAAAGVWIDLPIEHAGARNSPAVIDFGEGPLNEVTAHPMKVVTPGYFRTLGIPLIAGRTLERRDFDEETGATIVSVAFTRRYWADPGRAIGGRFKLEPEGEWYTIVGVVGDTHDAGLREAPPEMMYWAMRGPDGEEYFWPSVMSYAIRTEASPTALTPAVRQALGEIDPNLPIYRVSTMEEIVTGSLTETSFTMVLLAISSLMALTIGLVGIYGVMSYVVSQRTQEFGVRMAMGAGAASILKMVLRQGLKVIVGGATLGVLAAIAATRVLRSLLFGVEPLDAVTLGSVALALGLVALAAIYLPARRAASVDPVEALRYE